MDMAGTGQDADRRVRMDFMHLDPAAIETLRAFWPAVKTALPDILTGFYRHLLAVPALSRMIGIQEERLSRAQAGHWEKLFLNGFDEAYIESVRTIGMVHNRIGLEPRWYIGGYAFILRRLTALAFRHYRLNRAKALRAVQAVTVAVMLDMDYAISVYQEAMIEERTRRQRAVDTLIAAFEGEVTSALSALSSASIQLNATAVTMTHTASQTAEQATSVAVASEEATANVQAVAAAAEEMAASVAEISREVAQSSDIAASAVGEANATMAEVHRLSDAARSVDNVVKIINSIAGQTNLLALNATIEAARAGEAGRGFAVVAAEVKALAGQTAAATTEIAREISAMQTATTTAVERISEIGKTIGQMSGIAAAIAASVRGQGEATREISRNVQQAALGTSSVSSNVAHVSEAASVTGSAAGEVQRAAGHVASQGEHLRSRVSDFLASIRAA